MIRPYVTGICQAGLHERCPNLVRSARRTPKGTELPELWCSCPCHKETK